MPFNIGDRAKYVAGPAHRRGDVVTIIGNLRAYGFPPTAVSSLKFGDLVHEVDAPPRPGAKGAVAKPEWLKLYREGDEPAEHIETWIQDLIRRTEDA